MVLNSPPESSQRDVLPATLGAPSETLGDLESLNVDIIKEHTPAHTTESIKNYLNDHNYTQNYIKGIAR